MQLIKLLFMLIFLECSASSHKILVVFPNPSFSHSILASTIVKELANRGHKVTYITPFPKENWGSENIREIFIPIVPIYESKKTFFEMGETADTFERLHFILETSNILGEITLKDSNIQKLLKSDNEWFDLIVLPQFMNEANMVFAHKFKVPVVQIVTMPPFPWAPFQLGHPSSPAYVPNLTTGYTGKMTFWQRFANTIYDTYSILHHQFLVLPHHRELVKKYIDDKIDLYDFVNNVDLVLVNTDMSIYNGNIYPPNVIEIGGSHISEPFDDLPADLKRLLDEAKNGVILFSLGTNLKSVELPQAKFDGILKALAQFNETVLWKYENDQLPGRPNNVIIKKWLPQKEVLAHPNVKLFITHGGLFSVMESVYSGVPIVGIPVFSDQFLTVATAESHEYGLTVPFRELNEQTLTTAVRTVLTDPKFRNNAKTRSIIMKDQPMKPIDKAMFWIEYVIRHKGAPHLKYPGTHLTWYQRNLFDVYAVIILISLGSIYVCYRVFNGIKSMIVARFKNKQD